MSSWPAPNWRPSPARARTKPVSRPSRFLARFFVAGLVVAGLYVPLPTRGGEFAYTCSDNAHLGRLAAPLARMRRLVAARRPVTIMALGSSSTAGAGASTPGASYPARLEVELRNLFTGAAITVHKLGLTGVEPV